MASGLKGKLTVHIHQARDLKDVELIGKQDPYCQILIGEEQFKTKVVNDGGKHVTWEQAFLFNLTGVEDAVHIKINDKESLIDRPIGRVDISLQQLVKSAIKGPEWFQVHDVNNFQTKAGQIQISVEFKGTGLVESNTATPTPTECAVTTPTPAPASVPAPVQQHAPPQQYQQPPQQYHPPPQHIYHDQQTPPMYAPAPAPAPVYAQQPQPVYVQQPVQPIYVQQPVNQPPQQQYTAVQPPPRAPPQQSGYQQQELLAASAVGVAIGMSASRSHQTVHHHHHHHHNDPLKQVMDTAKKLFR